MRVGFLSVLNGFLERGGAGRRGFHTFEWMMNYCRELRKASALGLSGVVVQHILGFKSYTRTCSRSLLDLMIEY